MVVLVNSDLFTPRLKKEYCYTPTPYLVQSVQFSVTFTFQHPVDSESCVSCKISRRRQIVVVVAILTADSLRGAILR